jgi:hypothetical protein
MNINIIKTIVKVLPLFENYPQTTLTQDYDCVTLRTNGSMDIEDFKRVRDVLEENGWESNRKTLTFSYPLPKVTRQRQGD